MEVKQIVETTEESRKTEKLSKIETKLTVAEQKREQEMQRKLENIKINVGIFCYFHKLMCLIRCIEF